MTQTAARALEGSFFAHLRVGGCDVAVPVGDIVQAVPVPAAGLTPLPRRSGALAGLVAFEGTVVPVVGLDRWVALGAVGDPAAARIVVLRVGQALIGFQADALLGIHRVDAAAIHPLHHDADGDELFAAAIPASAERPLLCVLETARLMALAQAWCDAADLRPGAAAAAAEQRLAATVRYALFGIGADRWAIPATQIARLVKTPTPEMRWAGQLTCGICALDGRKLPMVDLAFAAAAAPVASAATGAASASAAKAGRPWLAVVADGPHSIGLVADRCDRLLSLRDDEIVKTPGDRLLAGTAIVDGIGTVSVLAVDKLFSAVPEAEISHIARVAGPAISEPAAAADSPSHYLVFEADRHYASPVAGLIGVVALPAATIDDLAAGRHATVAWRGDTVTVVNLPSINLPSVDASQAMPQPRLAVILEGEHEGRAGSAIAVRSLVDWLPARTARHGSMRMNGIGDVNVITSQRAHQGASLVVVDLAQMTYLLN